jgi:TolB-like protein/Tfp pilus assembly protein PilF
MRQGPELSTQSDQPGGVSPDKGRRIESWKGIARYLDRDVRSVQRWERERGLPVHRMPGEKGAVFAYEGELERWRHSRGVEADAAVPAEETTASGSENGPTAAVASPFRWALISGATIAALGILVGFALWVSRAPAPEPQRSSSHPRILAVLPLQNLSAGSSQDYFVDGFTDELTTELARLDSLRVISRTSTMLYRNSKEPLPKIARDLHANYILEGSVTREGTRVLVRAQLIDAATDTHISARDYNGDVSDVLDIQSQIARAIATDVSLELSPGDKAHLAAPRMVDPVAHDLYLQASYALAHQTPASIRQALALYQASAAKAPKFALAYVGIAQAQASLGQITAQSQEETERLEKDALLKALRIDPELGEARGLLGAMTYTFDHNWPEAERQLRMAVMDGAQAPTEARFGGYLVTRGRFAEGMAHIQTALELDPLGMSPRVNQFFALYFQSKFAEARGQLEEALARNPDFLAGHALLGLDSMMERDCARTTAEAQWVQSHFPSPVAEFEAALSDICRGDKASARQALATMANWKGPAFISPYQLALGYAAVGDKAAALGWIDRSISAREPQAIYLRVEPLFSDLRSDPRFIAQEKQLGLLQS